MPSYFCTIPKSVEIGNMSEFEIETKQFYKKHELDKEPIRVAAFDDTIKHVLRVDRILKLVFNGDLKGVQNIVNIRSLIIQKFKISL